MRFQDRPDEEVVEVADRIMDNLMEASTRIDHESHTRDFTDRLRAIVTRDKLTDICRRYQEEKGFFTERSLIGLVRRADGIAFLWTQEFTKAEGAFVAEALLVEREGRVLVDHVMVW